MIGSRIVYFYLACCRFLLAEEEEEEDEVDDLFFELLLLIPPSVSLFNLLCLLADLEDEDLEDFDFFLTPESFLMPIFLFFLASMRD